MPVSGEGSFPGAGFWESNVFGLLLILADNYNLTTNNPTTEAQSAQRTHRDFFGRGFGAVSGLPILAGCGPAAPGSPSTVPHPCLGSTARARGRCLWGRLAWAALSSGRAGLPGKRSCQGAGGRSGQDHGFHAKARSREVPMREGHFFAGALGPCLWSRFSTKAIRGDSRCPPGGPGCQASARNRGAGGPVGPAARKSQAGISGFAGGRSACLRQSFSCVVLALVSTAFVPGVVARGPIEGDGRWS